MSWRVPRKVAMPPKRLKAMVLGPSVEPMVLPEESFRETP